MKEKINHIFFSPLTKTVFSIVLFFTPYFSFSQCTTPISSFPYNENFETSNGNWVTGGTFSDWTWGTPSKPIINSAGSGSKCWITGGLNNAGYNRSEEHTSELQSPMYL